MIQFQLQFESAGKECTANIELEGIADSWDADITVIGHPEIDQFHAKFWMDNFLMPVFENRQDAIFFEPLLELIDAKAKQCLPPEFE